MVDYTTEGDQVRITVFALFILSGVSIYLLLNAIPASSIVSDIAGLGTHRGTSSTTGQCEIVTAVSRTYSPVAVGNPLYGGNTFFTETDQLRYTFFSGQLSGTSCTGKLVSSYTVASSSYPVTPAMIATVCTNLPTTTAQLNRYTCPYYPKNIISNYFTVYGSQFTASGSIPVFSLNGGVSVNNLVTWEAITI